MLDQDVLPRQPLARHGKRQGHGREQPLGHVGHDDPDREHAGVPEWQATRVADRKEHDAEPGRQRRDDPREECHLALERRQCRPGSLREVGDFPECRAHAGGEDHSASIARDQGRPGEQDVGAGRDLVLFARPGIPGDRQRFAGDRRAVDLHPERFDQAAVSRDAVTLVQPDDVSRHELARRQLDQGAPAFHRDHLRKQIAKRGERPFAPILLPEREQAIDQDDADDRERERTHPLARLLDLGEQGERGREPEDQREEVGELTQKADEKRRRLDPFDLVRTELGEPALCFGFADTLGPAMQAGKGVFDAQLVNAHLEVLRKAAARLISPLNCDEQQLAGSALGQARRGPESGSRAWIKRQTLGIFPRSRSDTWIAASMYRFSGTCAGPA